MSFCVFYLLLLLLLLLLLVVAQVTGELNLVILHTNDVHARIEEADRLGGPCTHKLQDAGECYGGASRIASMVKTKRQQFTNRTLLLDAGDQFQGTLWFFVFGGNVSAEIMNLIKYDAMSVGNHEFDSGVEGLVPFAQSLKFPLLASNMNLTKTPTLSSLVQKSTVVDVDGHRVAIVGYITPKTAYLSKPGTVTFTEELSAVQSEVDRLRQQGIQIVIALGHSGYNADLELAKHLQHVDVIVGGHTNTFLYTGKAPSNEVAQGEYPTVVRNQLGKPVLVVQDYAFGKYLGELHVTFDEQGEVSNWSGNPILLDRSVQKDQEIESLISKYLPTIDSFKNTIIGETYVDLLADRTRCRMTECNLGNVITDAMVYSNLHSPGPESWTEVAIAITNAGSFRASILKGNITVEQVIFVQPFRNSLEIVEVTGQALLDVLEFSVSKWTGRASDAFAGFLQVSGLQVVYDTDRPVGHRVVEVMAVCTKCRVPTMEPLQADKTYKVLVSEYLVNGGEGYAMLPSAVKNRTKTGSLDTHVLQHYITSRSPITTGLQNRIRHLKDVIDPVICKQKKQHSPSLTRTVAIPVVCISFTFLLFIILFVHLCHNKTESF